MYNIEDVKKFQLEFNSYMKYTHIKKELLSLFDDELIKLNSLISDIHTGTAKEKGDKLEDCANILVTGGNNYFEVYRNISTSTNEIDLLVRWTLTATTLNANNYFTFIKDRFLIECKNYQSPLDVTYVGKFYSLLKVSSINFGIIISTNGLTGRNWEAANGLVKKIALKDSIYILNIDLNDLKEIANKKITFLELIEIKFKSLITDVDIESFKKAHENEDKFMS